MEKRGVCKHNHWSIWPIPRGNNVHNSELLFNLLQAREIQPIPNAGNTTNTKRGKELIPNTGNASNTKRGKTSCQNQSYVGDLFYRPFYSHFPCLTLVLFPPLDTGCVFPRLASLVLADCLKRQLLTLIEAHYTILSTRETKANT